MRDARAVAERLPQAVRARLRRLWWTTRHAADLAVASRGGLVRVCTDVHEWSARHPECGSIPLAPARTVIRDLPRTVESSPLPAHHEFRTTHQPARYLVSIPNARVVHTSGLVVLPDGRLAAESVYGPGPLRGEPENFRRARRPSLRRPGQYFSLLSTWSRELNYYHWLHDTLLRLHLVVDHLPPDVRYIVPASLTPTLEETLEVLGIADRAVPFGADDSWTVDTLWFAPPTVHSGHDRRDSEVWLRQRFLEHYRIAPEPRRRIFVSRQDATRRRIANEPEVADVLRRYGFDTCVVGALTLREQVECFAAADVVVATHGAALTNLMFAPTGTRVLEIVSPSMTHNAFIYWSMASELGDDYWYITAGDEERPGGPPDTVVPIAALVATLDRMGVGTIP